MPADLYDVLGAPDDAPAEEIKRAYRERVREYHPDVNDHPDGDAQFKLIRTAHDVLSNPAERKTYDRLGHREYVERNLDDLPPVSVFPDEDLPDGVSANDTGAGTESSTASATAGTTSTTGTSASSTSTTTGRSTGSGSDTRTGTDTRTDRSSNGRGYGSTETNGTRGSGDSSADASTAGGGSATTADAASQTADRNSSSAGSDASSWDAATSSAQSATSSSSSVPAGVRRRRGLKRWYGVVALSLLVYLGGLVVYALPRQAALRGAVADAMTAPASTLLGPFPLASPTAYLLTAARTLQAGTPTLGAVLLAGTILLPLVVLTTVGRFGRGAAWTYAIPSLGPAVTLAVWPVVAVPTWAALLGLIVLPVLSGGGFLVDVGRYLRATR
ncbi:MULTISPECIES: DnaJ domain-containing protein [Halolamina]|uniref:DnaJ domain-containing protein n=1 Tax=Halolamina pelagica TaxID=699431 RepID=A0A1I5N1H7_9EURY|nr:MULTISPECIES: DnaJ domain-containing protein [Halolamina]NHX36243.1 DnaJ domain-containing protein [Halolamina sp. R1-12]SFP15121.1 DnaJ domain-containing protein [Halolamina pelagica]